MFTNPCLTVFGCALYAFAIRNKDLGSAKNGEQYLDASRKHIRVVDDAYNTNTKNLETCCLFLLPFHSRVISICSNTWMPLRLTYAVATFLVRCTIQLHFTKMFSLNPNQESQIRFVDDC